MKSRKSFSSIERRHLLPLLCAASVLKEYSEFNLLVKEIKKKNISFIKIYEALLQNYLFAGYPSALVSLKMLKQHYPKVKLKHSDDMNLYHFKKVGEKNCKMIYGDKYEKLMSNVRKFSPELSSWLILEGYGKVLDRKGLSLKERELCIISVLTCLKFEDQLFSHINGALRVGVSLTEIQKAINNLSFFRKRGITSFGNKLLRKYLRNAGLPRRIKIRHI